MATISGYRTYTSNSGVFTSGFYVVSVQDYNDYNGRFEPTGDLINQWLGSGNLVTSGWTLTGVGTNLPGALGSIQFNTDYPFLYSGINAAKTAPLAFSGVFNRPYGYENETSASGVTSGFGFYQRSLLITSIPVLGTGLLNPVQGSNNYAVSITGTGGPGLRAGTQVTLYRGLVPSGGQAVKILGYDNTVIFTGLTLVSGTTIKLVAASAIGDVTSNIITIS